MKQFENMPAGSFKAAFYQLNDKTASTSPVRRDFYKIWLILNKGRLVLEKEEIVINKPALVFLHPLAKYNFEPIDEKRSGYWCIFTKEFFPASSQYLLFNEGSLFQTDGQLFFINKDALPVARFYFEQIVKESNTEYNYQQESTRHLLELLIHEGKKHMPAIPQTSVKNAASRLTSRFLGLLEKQFPIASPQDTLKFKTPADYAGELAVHVNHLNAMVQQVTGKSTRKMITDRMLSESKALLCHSDWPVADIAYSLGFEYPNHFTAFFKKNTGATPLSLRK